MGKLKWRIGTNRANCPKSTTEEEETDLEFKSGPNWMCPVTGLIWIILPSPSLSQQGQILFEGLLPCERHCAGFSGLAHLIDHISSTPGE